MSKPKNPIASSPDARTVVPGHAVTYHNEPALSRAGTPKLGPSSTSQKTRRRRRVVRFSVLLPVAVELVVGTDDDDPSKDSDWEVLAVQSANCEATPRMVQENMRGSDFEALAATAANAKDMA